MVGIYTSLHYISNVRQAIIRLNKTLKIMKYFILRRDNYVNFWGLRFETSTYNRMGIVDWVFEGRYIDIYDYCCSLFCND